MRTKTNNHSIIDFNNIKRGCFNQFDQAMEYIENRRSLEDTKKAAQYKLTNYLANSLNICPQVVTKMALSSIQKANNAQIAIKQSFAK